MDIYTPVATDDPADVVIFLHGGSWQSGDKQRYRFVGVTLAEEGFVAVIPDYRKFPDVTFPSFVQDAAQAVAWVQQEIAAYGGNGGRIFVAGHSAGAHMGALLAVDETFLTEVNAPRAVAGFAGLAGPYHFTPEDPTLVDIFGPADRFPSMQASTFVNGTEPPILMQYGLQDDVVGQVNIDRLGAALDAKGVCKQVQLYADHDHVSIVGAFSWVLRGQSPVVDDMANFFRAISAGTSCPG